jgi:hypothetical protein
MGQVALVDDEDFEQLSKFKWRAQKSTNTFYAVREFQQASVYMHRWILGITNPKIQGHHQDGNGCNNQRSNLLTATRTQNYTAFRTLKENKTSSFRGVDWHRGKWRVRICVSKKRICIGYFHNEIDAAKAYDAAAIKYFGEFSAPNFPNINHQLNTMK